MAENEKKIVVDASVLVKWVLKCEEHFAQADFLREQIKENRLTVFVPGHCFSELCNVLSRKAPGKTLPSLAAMRQMGIVELALSLDLASIAFELTQKYAKISFYDAFYHAIALKHGILFITADEKYYKTTKKEGSVTLLRDYKSVAQR